MIVTLAGLATITDSRETVGCKGR